MNDNYGVATGESRGPSSALPFVAGAELETASVPRSAELWLYRERTIALLRRYLRISIEVGRLPSLLGRELFRSKVTSYRMTSLEDAVIFVHDVERALEQLSEFGRQLIAVIIFQEYTQEEAAEVLCCTRRTVCREFPEAVDCVSELFLEAGLLKLPSAPVGKLLVKRAKEGQVCVSDCKEAE